VVERVNFVVKTKEVKAKDVKNALEKAGIEVTSVIEVFREEEQTEEEPVLEGL
jgi:nitrogen regulatory protein PII